MLQDETEILNVLEKSREILAQQPQLRKMKPDEVLDFLDDGTADMLHYRWGVIAYLYVDSFNSFSYKELLSCLVDINDSSLTCEYIAYILQKKYGIHMVKLLIEANYQGIYSKIVPYVKNNLFFEDEIEITDVDNFLMAIEKNKNSEMTILFSNFSKLIIQLKKQDEVFEHFLQVEKNNYFNFMHYFFKEVYLFDSISGDRMLDVLLNNKESGIDRISVDALNTSIYYNCQIFEKYFQKIHNWMQQNYELRKELIPTYTIYVKKYTNEELIDKALIELKKVISSSLPEKKAFLKSVVYEKSLTDDLNYILNEILLQPFEKDNEILSLINQYYYVKKLPATVMLKQWKQIFFANGYGVDYKDFFDEFNSLFHELKKEQKVILDQFINSMLSKGIENLYFALGLYENLIKVSTIAVTLQEQEINITALSLILKGLLYYTFNANNICMTSFQFLQLIPDHVDAEPYLTTCMEDVYENYSYTYWNIANQQECNCGKWTSVLVKRIIDEYKKQQSNQDLMRNIPDLQQSSERMRQYRKAQIEYNEKINKKANEKSIFANFFPRRIMKYGERHAFIQVARKGEYFYHVAPYSISKYEAELPAIYINDPVTWVRLGYQYFKERDNYCASSN